ncbi:MAG: hypothetical protein R3C19_15850 [Planctomycetaceae bacterium]
MIEVILATAILMGSVVVLARLASMGRSQANRAALNSEAQQLCETTLNEILLGLRPSDPVEGEPLLPVAPLISDVETELLPTESPFENSSRGSRPVADETPDWIYSVRTAPVNDMPELLTLTVAVTRTDSPTERPVSFMLTRWVLSETVETETNTSFGQEELMREAPFP